MKILAFAIATLIALAGSALAQQAPSAPNEQLDQANAFIQMLERQRNDAANQSVVEHAIATKAQSALQKAQAEISSLSKENAELKAKINPPAPPAP